MGSLIQNLPEWCVEAKTTANGFQGGFIRRDEKKMIASESFSKLHKGVVINSSFPVIASLSLTSFITSGDKARALAGATCDVTVNIYVLPAATIPEDLTTLENVWSDRRIVPYDSNMYSGALKTEMGIPLSRALYLVVVTLDDMADIPAVPAGRAMRIQESVSITGVPADKQAELYQTIIDQVGTVVQRLDTEISKFTQLIADTDNITTLATKMDAQTAQLATEITKMDSIAALLTTISNRAALDYTATLSAIQTGVETLHTDLDGV